MISAFKPPQSGEKRYWDTQTAGLLVRVWPSGRKVFYLRVKRRGRALMQTIGECGSSLTIAEARLKAATILSSGRGGQLPVRDRPNITVSELCDRYLAEGPLTKVSKRPSSWRTDTTNLRRHVQPLLGKKFIYEVTRADVTRMVRDITIGVTAGDIRTKRQGIARVRGGAGIAARTKTTFSAMFNWAINHELADKNPAIGVEVAKTRVMERFLSDAEVSRLLATMSELVESGELNPQHADVVRLLLFTGARKMEIMGLQWAEVDLPNARLTISPERTKCGSHNGVRRIPLSAAAIKILSKIERENEFVFPADRGTQSGHMTGIQKSWKEIRERCALGNMRLHDLRHSFASFAITNGESIFIISAVLGHSTTRMTERYLHLRDEDARGMAERTAQRISRSCNGTVVE
jgi:integrase